VFATADELRLTAAAWCSRSRGRNAQIMIQVAIRQPAAAQPTITIDDQVMAVTLRHSWP
jgi:hypothetical protein